jgi:hypothetical protein
MNVLISAGTEWHAHDGEVTVWTGEACGRARMENEVKEDILRTGPGQI